MEYVCNIVIPIPRFNSRSYRTRYIPSLPTTTDQECHERIIMQKREKLTNFKAAADCEERKKGSRGYGLSSRPTASSEEEQRSERKRRRKKANEHDPAKKRMQNVKNSRATEQQRSHLRSKHKSTKHGNTQRETHLLGVE